MSGSICALEKVPRAPGLRGSCAGMSCTGTGEVSGQGSILLITGAANYPSSALTVRTAAPPGLVCCRWALAL